MLLRTALATFLASAIALPLAAQDADTVIAKVNDTEITLGHMAAMKMGLPPEMAQIPSAELWDLMLDQMIRQAAMAEQGEATMTPRDEAALAIDRRAYLAGAAIERLADFEPTDEEIQAAYEKAFPADAPVTEYDADHILLQTEEAAKAVIEELEGGADFAKLAEERSVDTASGLNGGDLGWFTRDRMVAEFGDAVAEMEKGSVSSEPVQSQFGWHVIKLNDSRVQEPPALADVREPLIQQIRRDKVEAEIEKITKAAKIERTEGIDPTLLDRDILGQDSN